MISVGDIGVQLPKDKNGKTENEFLREYDVTRYFRPSVTVDAVLFCKKPHGRGAKVLLIERGGHPFIGKYAFPGGFVEQSESCESAAARELYEETGIAGIALRQLLTASTPDRDPRHRNITVVFCARVSEPIAARGGDDAADAKWFDITATDGEITFESDDEKFLCRLEVARDPFGKIDINNTRIIERGKTAFDHAKIIYYLLDSEGLL